MPDTRETINPAWEALARRHSELEWNLTYYTFVGQSTEPARRALEVWEVANASEWNRLKPWYAPRLTTWRSRLVERFEEKQLP